MIFGDNLEPCTIKHTTAIWQSGKASERCGHGFELVLGRECDPESEIGAQDTAQLLGAEFRYGLRDTELLGDFGVVGAGG